VVAKVMERLAVSKQAVHKYDVEGFNLRKLSGLEVRKQFQSKISNRLAALENLNDSENIKHSWVDIKVRYQQSGELHEELNDMDSSPNIIQSKSRRTRWAGHVACMGERIGTYRVLVEKPEGNRPLGRPRCRWEDNIKMDLQDVGWLAWTGLILLRKGTGGRHL
jgi:hypothetical protein